MTVESGPDRGEPPERSWTVHEVLMLVNEGLLPQDRGQLLLGELVVACPMGPLYRSLTVIVRQLLGRALGPGFHVQDHAPLLADAHNLPHPAIAVIRGPAEAFVQCLPSGSDAVVVVEIATGGRREQAGAAVYAAAGVPRFWQIQPRLRQVVVWTEPDPQRAVYRSVHYAGAGDSIELVGRSVPVARVLPPGSAYG